MSRPVVLVALAAALVLAPQAGAAFRGTGYSVFDYDKRGLYASRGLVSDGKGGALLALAVGAGENQMMGVVRIDSRGRRVKGFGKRGLATAQTGSGWMEDTATLQRLGDGRIVVTGTSAGAAIGGKQPKMGVGLAQFTASGAPDTSVGGGDGKVRHEFPEYDLLPDFVFARPGGGVAVGGTGFGGATQVCVAGFTPSLEATDPGYNSYCYVPRGSTGARLVDGVALPDGRIVVGAGSTHLGENEDEPDLGFGIARLLADGSVDQGFGTVEGFTFERLGFSLCDDVRPDARRLSARGGGGWVVGGGTGCRTALVGFTEAGAVDRSFGENGRVVVDLDPTSGEEVMTGLVPLPDGGFASVSQRQGSGTDLIVARWKADGRPDASFDGDGRVRLRLSRITGYTGRFSGGIMLRAGGGLLVAGSVSREGRGNVAVIALNRQGKLDRGFGAGRVSLKK